MKRILYLEDDTKLAQIVIPYLKHFYEIDHISSLGDVDSYLEHAHYDIAILDRNIQQGDVGLLAIEKILQKNADISIIITSAYGTVDDKIKGLSLGADDYLEKPFDVRELAARINAQLRKKSPEQINYKGLQFNINNKQIFYKEEMILLSQKENKLLFFLLENANKLFSAQELIYALYSHPDDILPNTITVTIGKIRKKLPVEIIKTFKTRGYMIELF
jgi:two-component system OmpR family response regulator